MSEKHIEQILEEQGVYICTTVGKSMFPMLRNRKDTIIVRPISERLHKYDIPLYKRGEDYVLHRIVKVTADGYVICGDNCLYREYQVTDDDIVGVLTAFYRGERLVNMSGIGYRLYSRLWVAGYPIRFILKKFCLVIKQVVNNVFQSKAC